MAARAEHEEAVRLDQRRRRAAPPARRRAGPPPAPPCSARRPAGRRPPARSAAPPPPSAAIASKASARRVSSRAATPPAAAPRAAELQRRRRAVDRQRRGRARRQRRQREAADMGEDVEHAPPARQPRREGVVRPLVVEEPGLLPLREVGEIDRAVHRHRDRPVERAREHRRVVVEPLERPRPPAGVLHHRRDAGDRPQRLDQRRQPRLGPGGVRLHHRRVAEPVDRPRPAARPPRRATSR